MQDHDDSAAQWLEVTALGSKAESEEIEAWLFDAGALSVTLSDGIDDEKLIHAVLEPAPGEIRLWNEITLVGLFALGSTEEQVTDSLAIAALNCGMKKPAYSIRTLRDQAWERAWMDSFKPMRFGHRLWICPRDEAVVDENAATIKLDPGMAFGTGTHATTAQCLEWLGEQTLHTLTPLAGKRVIDYGCGSGVLAIAALLLGAEHVWAVDIDEQALIATGDNAACNGVLERLTVGMPAILQGVESEVLLANILFQPLMQLANIMPSHLTPGGSLVMSGILEEQMKPLRMRYNNDFRFEAERLCDGWALMSAIRR